jgi:hypothetical protein
LKKIFNKREGKIGRDFQDTSIVRLSADSSP